MNSRKILNAYTGKEAMGVRRLLKRKKKIQFSSKKVINHTISAGQGGGKGPLLPSPADAHERGLRILKIKANVVRFPITYVHNAKGLLVSNGML